MNYTNSASRLHVPTRADAAPQTPTFLSLESSRLGRHLRVRTAATLARRKASALKLAATAVAATAFFAPADSVEAQLNYDPFAGNASHTEERWVSATNANTGSYTDPATNGTNRPNSLTGDAVNAALLNATAFNFRVTSANSNAFLIPSGGPGNIYSFDQTLTLTLTSTYAPPTGTFNTVVFSIRVAGTPLNTAGVLLTPNNGAAVAPRFTNAVLSGSGMAAVTQYAFQFDLSAVGGSNNFFIVLPASGASASFGGSQLDTTTAAYGAVSVVPEPSTAAATLAGVGGLMLLLRRRQRPV